MSIPDAAVSFLLDNLVQIIKYNYHLVADVGENIRALRAELLSIEGLMKDFTKYNHDSDYLKSVVREIKSTIHEAEDAVDTYVVLAAVQKSRGRVSKALHTSDYSKKLRELGKEIQQISDKVRRINVEKAKSAYEILQYQAILKLSQPVKSKEDPIVEEEHVVGFDGAIEDVSQLLIRGAKQYEVISIVGMLGLGKTTLAKKVFNHKDVDFEYMIRAFAYVSREYEAREVFLKILSSFTKINDEVNQMSEDQLRKHLSENLKGKQYLVVLDDVWEKEDWDNLKGAFPYNNKRCRVLITTRHEKVAEYAKNSDTPLYRLEFLKLDKSRELLRWKVFRDNVFREELDDYEEEIARKCDGLPLAIVVIAGIVFNHRDRVDWWKSVADSVKDYIAKDQEQTTKVIELMYKHLPNHLKMCFMYLGIFADDFEIPVWKLVRLWIAEGLIRKEGNLNLEDIAEEHLEELVYRNVVMVGQRRSNDRIKTCILHDTLREFCKKEAVEENLFKEIKKDNQSSFSFGNSILDEHRRLCINNVNVLDFISSSPSGKCVRSFLNFAREETTVQPKYVSSIPKTFKLLRVLEVQSLKFTRYPIELNRLVLLKYVAISSTFSSLPKSMSDLWNMQTLIVNTESYDLKIEADIWKLPQFRHLHTNTSTILPCPDPKNPKIDQDIQTLSTIDPGSCNKEILGRTHKLKKLGVRGRLTELFKVSGESSLFGYLQDLGSLENLRLVNDDVYSKLDCLPSDKNFPQHLTKLTLLATLLDWQEMPKLGKLEKLEILKLKDYAFQGKKWPTEKGGFLQLKHLHIGTTDLEEWEASPDHFPKLKCLELNGCDKLKAVPDGLANISSLQQVVLHCTSTDVASSASQLQAEKGGNFKLSVYPPEHLKGKQEA